MTKKYLQDWYNSSNINYNQKERLNKIGVSDYDYHYLQDLEQILSCESWAKNDFIRQAESNHSYTCSKYTIAEEKFQERIEVYPKDWCRVS